MWPRYVLYCALEVIGRFNCVEIQSRGRRHQLFDQNTVSFVDLELRSVPIWGEIVDSKSGSWKWVSYRLERRWKLWLIMKIYDIKYCLSTYKFDIKINTIIIAFSMLHISIFLSVRFGRFDQSTLASTHISCTSYSQSTLHYRSREFLLSLYFCLSRIILWIALFIQPFYAKEI